MILTDVLNVSRIYNQVVDFFDSGKDRELLMVDLVFKHQIITIKVMMKKEKTVIDIFTNVIKFVKLFFNTLIRVSTNEMNSEFYVIDRKTASKFINVVREQNNQIYKLLLLNT